MTRESAPAYSMTGYASTEGLIGDTQVRIEIRSLNHRFLDLKLRLPKDWAEVERPLRSFLQENLKRGSVELKIEPLPKEKEEAKYQIQMNTAVQYHKELQKLQKELGLDGTVLLKDLLSLPDVLTRRTTEDSSSTDQLWNQTQAVVETALHQMREMRKKEGHVLVETLFEKMKDLETLRKKIETLRKETQSEYENKIKEKVTSLFEHYPVKETSLQSVLESRISQELALLLDRTDIDEELTRSEKHIQHFEKTLKDGGALGKKLEFLLQELHREINTLGNKAQDHRVSENVVQMKVLIEQIREQVMNLE